MLTEVYKLKVFENRVLRRLFIHRGKEETGDWRKFHNKELHNLCCSPNIIGLVKSKRIVWTNI
jgi:hypothetical protein